MERIRIAQIGMNANSHAVDIFERLKKHTDLFEIVGYVLPENERERLPHRLSCFDGYPEISLEQVLNDPTIPVVTVETDEVYLTKYAQMAADAGKHIHMEKPGGTDQAAFEKLIETVKKKNTVFHTGYMYRYNPYVQELMAQIRNGELGEIISVEAQMNCLHPAQVRQWLQDFPGGMMFFLGCHLIDLIFQIQGKPNRVIPFQKASGIDGVTAKDFTMAVFEYDHGVSFAKTTAVEIGGFARRQLVVNGTKGTVELKPLEWYLPDYSAQQTGRVTHTEQSWYQYDEQQWSVPVDRYDAMMEAFAAMVRGEKQNPYTPDYELELYRLVMQACS